MTSWLTAALVARGQSGYRPRQWGLLAVATFAISFVGYAVDVFVIPGGVVWIPGDAALVGVVAGIAVAYAGGGVLPTWLVTYASLLGYAAQRAHFGYSNTTLREELGYFFDLESLFVFALEGLVLALIGVVIGAVLRASIETVRRHTTEEPP